MTTRSRENISFFKRLSTYLPTESMPELQKIPQKPTPLKDKKEIKKRHSASV